MKLLIAVGLVALIAIAESMPHYYPRTTRHPTTRRHYHTRPTNRPASDCKGHSYFSSKVCKNGYLKALYLPYNIDCTCFIQCDEAGVAHLRPCAPGTRWSQKDLTCVHGTKCSVVNPTYVAPTPKRPSYERKPSSCRGYKLYSYKKTACKQNRYDVRQDYREYRHDCSCFLQCSPGGKFEVMPCGQGTVWDDSRKTCVRPCRRTCGYRPNPVKIKPEFCRNEKYYDEDEDQDEFEEDFEE